MNRNTILIVFLALSITVIFSGAASAASNNNTMESHAKINNLNSHSILNTTVKTVDKNLTTPKIQNNTTTIKKAVATINSKNKIYVNGSNGKDTNSGLDWANAKKTIQNGINTVDNDGYVYIASGTYLENLIISKDKLNVHLIGLDKNGTIIKGKNKGDSVIWITTSGNVVHLENLKIQDGIAKRGGGIYNCKSTLYITNCIFSNNEARNIDGNNEYNYGGAIYNDGGNLFIDHTLFLNNIVDKPGNMNEFRDWYKYGDGGAVYNEKGTCVFKFCTFEGNEAKTCAKDTGIWKVINVYRGGLGGAIYNNDGRIDMNSCNFTRNIAQCGGGAIYNCGTMNIKNCNFYNNSAPISIDLKSNEPKFFGGYGGAIYNNEGSLDIENSNFKNNSAGVGGAIYNNNSKKFTLYKSTFNNNKAEAIDKNGKTLVLHTNTVDVNKIINAFLKMVSGLGFIETNPANGIINIKASVEEFLEIMKSDVRTFVGVGGAICFDGTGNICIDNCIFSNNSASLGGAIASSNEGEFKVDNSEFSNNFAETYGGAIYINSLYTSGTITNCDFNKNRSLRFGGAICYSGKSSATWGYLDVNHNNFTNNEEYTGCIYIGIDGLAHVLINYNNIYCDDIRTNNYGIYNQNELTTVSVKNNHWTDNSSEYNVMGNIGKDSNIYPEEDPIIINTQETRGSIQKTEEEIEKEEYYGTAG